MRAPPFLWPTRVASLHLGAHQLYLGSVQRGLNINQAAGLAHLAGLYMLGNHIDLLDDDFTLGRLTATTSPRTPLDLPDST